jgi:hypothetical protein
MRACLTTPVTPAASGRPKDGPHVLWVFNAVEDDQQDRARRVLHEFFNRDTAGIGCSPRPPPWWTPPLRHLLEHPASIDRFDGNAQFLRPRDDGVHSRGPAPRSCTTRETRRAFIASATV